MLYQEKYTQAENYQEKELINPKGTEAAYHFMQLSQAVKVGNMVWVSGQVGMNEDLEIADGIAEQAKLAFQNLRRVIEEAGGTMDDIVELTTYHTDMKDMRDFGQVKSEFITNNYPAWTAVGVNELPINGLLLEIKATVYIKETY